MKAWICQELGAQALCEVARVLSDAGLPIVPVKGIVLARWIYEDLAQRPIADVDLLMPWSQYDRARSAVKNAGWRVLRVSEELGELGFVVRGFQIDLHAFMGRRELADVTVEEVVARATPDRSMFGFPIERIDEVDHFLLVVLNVVKDWFILNSPHQEEDLRRMLFTLADRQGDIVARARKWSITNGLYNVCTWVTDQPGNSEPFQRLLERLGPPPRPVQAAVAGWTRRTSNPNRYINNAIAVWTNDRPALRLRALARIVRRGAFRTLGQDPEKGLRGLWPWPPLRS